ncbi:MAG TPA: hypothetical protein VEA59_01285 [Patescibacteria group bacterium]|nr:hypothetical protein [Patescibacteria group bacterium]
MTNFKKYIITAALLASTVMVWIALHPTSLLTVPTKPIPQEPLVKLVGSATPETPAPKTSSPPPAAVPTPKKTLSKPTPSATVVRLNGVYDSTITSFRDQGRSFQFVDCKIVPQKGSSQMKAGSKFAVQNAGKATNSFEVMGYKFNLPPDSYAVIAASVTGTSNIFCQGIPVSAINVIE